MVTRRGLLAGLGALAAGAGGLVATGAFDTVEAERSVTLETAGDADAFLGITPGAGGDKYITQNGTIEIDISETEAGGSGVNENAITAIDQLLEVTNNGTNTVEVGFKDEYAIDKEDYDEAPGGWGYAVSEDEDAAVVAWASPLPEDLDEGETLEDDVRPGLTTTGFDGSTLVDGRTIVDEIDEIDERTIQPGGSLNIGVLVDTRESTVEENDIPDDLTDAITLFAESTS